MNVQNRRQFNDFLKDLKTNTVKVFDTETNGLHMYAGQHLISLSVYFPEVDRSYNLPFFHGIGEVEVKYTDSITPETPFSAMAWQGRTKKQLYLKYWFEMFHLEATGLGGVDNYFKNLPSAWLNEVKAAWGKGIYYGHNTRFDAHVLYAAGFPDMEMVYDTMIALHLVNEDWRNIYLDAPYTWNKKEAPDASLVGQWARSADGTLLHKVQPGNRQLKWQSAAHGFENATTGEEGLHAARTAFEEVLTDYIMERLHDPMNDSLLLAKVKSNKATPADMEKQREKIRAKVEIDDKANMWMLPSTATSKYAEGDVRLTWDLYNWCLPIIKQWDNMQLWEDQSRIHHFVAWEMERNGFKLDKGAAELELEKLQPRIAEIQDILIRLASEYGMDDFNANSPKTLLPFLNSGILGEPFDPDLFPTWMDQSVRLGLQVYPNVRVNEFELEDSGDELLDTAKAELERVEDHGIVRLIKELRRMNKSANTYLKKWIKAADQNDIVRFSINDDGTVAGRASSSGDAGNGQNIPDRNGYTIKRAIVPYNDQWRLVAFDYGQLELRLGAWIAETLLGFDPNMTMTKLFQSGEDMHSYVRDMIGIRSILFGDFSAEEIVIGLGYSTDSNEYADAEATVEKHCRQVAKTLNFGLLYSGGAPMIMKLLKLPKDVAQTLVRKWRDLFPAFPKTQQYFTDLSLTRRLRPDGAGYGMYATQPISGRHRKLQLYKTEARYFKDGEWRTFNPREAAARKVWNNTVQGLGGYLAMYSAYRIGQELGREHIKMFANIHDALEMNVHVDHLDLVPRIAAIMIDWPEIVPALTVDMAGSKDGTWQGITPIADFAMWLKSKGTDGYPKKKKEKK